MKSYSGAKFQIDNCKLGIRSCLGCFRMETPFRRASTIGVLTCSGYNNALSSSQAGRLLWWLTWEMNGKWGGSHLPLPHLSGRHSPLHFSRFVAMPLMYALAFQLAFSTRITLTQWVNTPMKKFRQLLRWPIPAIHLASQVCHHTMHSGPPALAKGELGWKSSPFIT